MAASWSSVDLEIAYYVLGWISFFSWAFCYYPQVILNFTRKSVQGLNFDFVALNVTTNIFYLIYNASVFFSPVIQEQYRQKFGFDEMIPVATNDVAFSVHAVILTSLTLSQVAVYDRGDQKVSRVAISILAVAWLSAAACVLAALLVIRGIGWFLASSNTLQIVMTIIKYTPQAVFNFRHKSTVGFSIGFVLLDFLGSISSVGQISMQAIDQRSAVNIYGNIGKTLLSLVSLFFDTLFLIQIFVLFPAKNSRSLECQKPLLENTCEEP